MASFTSVTHDKFVAEQWKDETRVAVEAAQVLVKRIKNIPHDKKVKGDVIHIPDVSNLTAQDLNESDADLSGQAVTESEFTLTINKKKHITVYIPKHLGEALSHYDFRKEYTGKIGYGLGVAMESDAWALYSGLSQYVGCTADGLEGNISDNKILAAVKKLVVGDVPSDRADWSLIMNASQEPEMYKIDKFVRADAVGDSKIEQANLGRIYGVKLYFTTLTPVKALATAPATVADANAGLLMHKDCLAIAIPQDVDIDFEYLPQKKAWLLSGDCLYGVAEFRDAFGVCVYTLKP